MTVKKIKLSDILERIRDKAPKDKQVRLGNIVEDFEGRGFGPVLLVPALLVLLPTGAIPGVPTIAGIIIFLIAIQMVFGKKDPWLPKKLKRVEFDHDHLKLVINKSLPYTRRLDKLFHTRLELLTSPPLNRILALCCALMGLWMMPLELLPFAAIIPASAIVLIALGLSTRDGLLILVAFGLILAGGGYLLLQK